jgi:hypothetical protein
MPSIKGGILLLLLKLRASKTNTTITDFDGLKFFPVEEIEIAKYYGNTKVYVYLVYHTMIKIKDGKDLSVNQCH